MEDNRICGVNAVSAVFATRPDDVRRLFYASSMRGEVGAFCSTLAQTHRPYRMLEGPDLDRAAGTVHHGGIAAVVAPRIVAQVDFVRPPRHDLILILDGVANPHNLGAVARSAAFFGAGALILHQNGIQAMPTDAAYRVAEGGMEHLDVFLTRNLRKCLEALEPFYRTVAATLTRDAMPLERLPRDRPVALVLGNEEKGVGFDALQACRRQIRIADRSRGAVQSLNVAQAASVMLHDLSRTGVVLPGRPATAAEPEPERPAPFEGRLVLPGSEARSSPVE